jgi:Heavy-metal resistance
MNLSLIAILTLGLLLAAPAVFAAEEPDPTPPANRPDPAALRERAKKLSPEQRQKMMREFRDRNGTSGTNRTEWEKRREELKKLPAAERSAKLKELRKEIQQGRDKASQLSAEERDAKRSELKTRIDGQIAELQKRKAEGVLSESEQRRMERMEQMSKRLGRGPSAKQGQKGAPAKDGEVLPPPAQK